MNASPMREPLLQQGSATLLEPGMKMLNELVEAENRRANRLTRWTIVIWAGWFFVFALLFLIYPLMSYDGAEAAKAPAAPQPQNSVISMIVLSVFALTFAGLLLLPIAGIILLVLMVLARRSATTAQIQCSLGAIEAQLKQLNAAQKTPPLKPPA